jgi:hypothetical protein
MNPGQGNPHEKGGGVQRDETFREHAEMPLPEGVQGLRYCTAHGQLLGCNSQPHDLLYLLVLI